jgi:hypothetical protein
MTKIQDTQLGQAKSKKEKRITKARKGERTKAKKIDSVISEFRVFVVEEAFS